MVYDNGMLIKDNRNLLFFFLGESLYRVDLCGGQKNWTSCSFNFIIEPLRQNQLILIHYTFLAF